MERSNRPVSGRVWVRLTLLLLILAAVAGFVFLSVKIHAGEKQLAAGHRKLERGQVQVEKGKRRLKDGERRLSEGKAEFTLEEDSLFSEFFDDVFNDGEGFAAARDSIAEGERQVAGGQKRMTAGKQRLTSGRKRFDGESRHLALAKVARICCAGLAAFLVALWIFLRFFRR